MAWQSWPLAVCLFLTSWASASPARAEAPKERADPQGPDRELLKELELLSQADLRRERELLRMLELLEKVPFLEQLRLESPHPKKPGQR